MPEILLTLTATAAAPAEAESRLLAARAKLEALIGPSIISDDGRTLEEVVGALLTESGRTLAIAESCTGGMIAARCTDVPGRSAWFLEGAVVYDNAAKTRRLGLPEALLAEHGAVSERCRRHGRGHAADRRLVDFAAVTGIAGPTGGRRDKRSARCFWRWRRRRHASLVNKFPGRSPARRQLTAENALNTFARRLLS
jgi:PncC family amidohydrolase